MMDALSAREFHGLYSESEEQSEAIPNTIAVKCRPYFPSSLHTDAGLEFIAV